MPVWWESQALISKYSKNTGSPMFSWHLQAEAFSSQTMRGRAAHGEDFSAQLGEERKGETVSIFRRWRPWFWMPDVIPTIRFFVSSQVPSAPIYFTRDWFFSQIQNSPPWGQFFVFIPNHQKCNQTEITAAGNLGNSQLTLTSSPLYHSTPRLWPSDLGSDLHENRTGDITMSMSGTDSCQSCKK